MMIKLHKTFRNILRDYTPIIVMFLLFITTSAYADPDEEYLKYCKSDIFEDKYERGGCWSCDIIAVIMRNMLDMIAVLFDAIVELCEVVLVLGAAIWLAIYFLKSLGSFAAQDPAKVIDGALLFMFKWALIYTLISQGIAEILKYIVSPLLSIGIDVGTIFSNGVGF